MGPKFAIVFCGVNSDNASDFINEIKESTEKLQISLSDNNFTEQNLEENSNKKTKNRTKKKKEDIVVSPVLNFVVSTYYKGTGIEIVLKSLEKYLDDAESNTSQISSI